LVPDFLGWEKASGWILNLVKKHGSKDVLEVGSGANPTLCPDIVAALKIRYTANDVSHAELVKSDRVFDRWVCNLATDEIPPQMRGRFDLVFSRMVNEHISDAQTYHAKIHSLLKPGGLAAHCFSTLYSLPFVANRILPESMSAVLLNLFGRRDLHKHGKFRTYYSWCRGPSSTMISRFEALGYEVAEYAGYFGHNYYIGVPVLHRLECLKARMLLAKPIATLCSYSMLIVRKPWITGSKIAVPCTFGTL
jgi:SAM-dependent methyltransferase